MLEVKTKMNNLLLLNSKEIINNSEYVNEGKNFNIDTRKDVNLKDS